ncbi:MAG TPA: lysophospholipid acyltransferase family protein [Thermoanaerobaculia bacterium]
MTSFPSPGEVREGAGEGPGVRAPGRGADKPAPILLRLARLVLKAFFREVEVVGAERIPRDRPLVLIANHVNGLIDPLLLVEPLPVHPRFLAKSTLWKNPLVRPFLTLAGAIPVYRRQDEGVDPAKNAETFARSHELLGSGGVLALFPEGGSHNEPGLLPLKTGAARIVLESEKKYPGLGVRIVPVGLLFDSRETFRSRALIQVGPPIDPAPQVAQAETDPQGAVRALTDRMDDGLKDVTLNYDTWEDARLIARAADLYRRRAPELPSRGRLSEGFSFRKAFLQGYLDLRRSHPDEVAAAARRVKEYDDLLRAFHLRDDQVGAAYPPSPVLRFVVRTFLRLLVHLPLATIGTFLNYPVYRLVGSVVKRLNRQPDQIATYKMMGALFLFPLTWITEGFLAAHYWGKYVGEGGAWIGLAAALLAPVTGYVALLFHDRRAIFWHEARAYLLLRTRRRLAEELKARREAVLRQVEDLAALYGSAERLG